ncbi:MAG: hypothetical protein ACO1TE_12465 [Prosthecobacter sp.]
MKRLSRIAITAAIWIASVLSAGAQQTAAEVVAALHAQMAERAAVETVLDLELENYVNFNNGAIAKEVQNRSRQRITARLLSLDRWVVSMQSKRETGDYKDRWISDGSGCYARIEEPYRAGQPAVINVAPYELNILTSLLNGDCLLITLASLRSADPASFKLESEMEADGTSTLVLTGRDAKAAMQFRVRLDKETLQPLSHELHSEDRLLSSLMSAEEEVEIKALDGTKDKTKTKAKTRIWKKLMFTNDRKLMETQVWTPVSTTPLPEAESGKTALILPEPTLNFPLQPGYTLFVDLPHLKLTGMPSEKFAGKRLGEVVSVGELK